MNEIMREDIFDQPLALSTFLPNLREQAGAIPLVAPPRRIGLTGTGDSLIAALAVTALYRRSLPAEVLAIPALDAGRYERWHPSDLVVCISVSGEVSRTIEAALAARAAGATTIAITCGADSTLAGSTTHRLVMPPPIDRTIPHCRDYTFTLLALVTILERLCGEPFSEVARWIEEIPTILRSSTEAIERLPSIEGRTWFLGAGPDRATAMYGALKYWEAAGLDAWWDDLEEFAHGSKLMTVPGDRVVIIGTEGGLDRGVEMISGLRKMHLDPILVCPDAPGGIAAHLSTASLGSSLWHPFTSCLPLQVLAYEEATRRSLDVSIPLDGKPYGPAYDEVHGEWTKRSQIKVDTSAEKIGPHVGERHEPGGAPP